MTTKPGAATHFQMRDDSGCRSEQCLPGEDSETYFGMIRYYTCPKCHDTFCDGCTDMSAWDGARCPKCDG